MRFSTKGTCIIDACERQIYAKRVCIKHYERLKYNGVLEGLNFSKDNVKQCLAYGCKGYDYENGYCLDHLEIIRDHGSPYVPRIVLHCEFCNKVHYQSGLCEKHYKELQYSIRNDIRWNGPF